MGNRVIGISGEVFASELLKKSGYILLERNFRSKIGEIDIIALKNDTLVFVEVKTRISTRYGKAEEAVTPHKIKTISRVAELYSKLHPNLPKKLRIDVVALEVTSGLIKSSKIIEVS